MRPPPFEYAVAESVGDAIAKLSQFGGDAKILAGSQSLLPLLNFRLANPHYLVDINRLSELDYMRPSNGKLMIGAMTRQRTIEQSLLIHERYPLMYEAVQQVGHRQTRNRGTIGGSLAHAEPAAELPSVIVALGARLHIGGPAGERSATADEFFQDVLTTAITPDEILLAVELPALPGRSGTCFCEFSRRHGDFAVVGAAALVALDNAGRVDRVGLSLMGSAAARTTRALAPPR